jgi:hypothetical protein
MHFPNPSQGTRLKSHWNARHHVINKDPLDEKIYELVNVERGGDKFKNKALKKMGKGPPA